MNNSMRRLLSLQAQKQNLKQSLRKLQAQQILLGEIPEEPNRDRQAKQLSRRRKKNKIARENRKRNRR